MKLYKVHFTYVATDTNCLLGSNMKLCQVHFYVMFKIA